MKQQVAKGTIMKIFGERSRLRMTLSVILLLVAASPAAADNARFKDPADARGRLDIKLSAVGHATDKQGDELLIHRLTTRKPWPSQLLKRKATEFDIWLDSNGDDSTDRVVYVGFEKGRLVAEMHEYEQSGDSGSAFLLGEVRVMKPARDRIKIFVPREWLADETISEYRWYAISYFFERDHIYCSESYACDDRAPNSGWLTHELG